MKIFLVFLCFAGGIYACSNQGNTHSAAASADGNKIYQQYCKVCHGIDGKLGLNGAKDLTTCKLTEAERIVQVTEGKNTMTPFKNVLNPDEIKAVVAYTFTLK